MQQCVTTVTLVISMHLGQTERNPSNDINHPEGIPCKTKQCNLQSDIAVFIDLFLENGTLSRYFLLQAGALTPLIIVYKRNC